MKSTSHYEKHLLGGLMSGENQAMHLQHMCFYYWTFIEGAICSGNFVIIAIKCPWCCYISSSKGKRMEANSLWCLRPTLWYYPPIPLLLFLWVRRRETRTTPEGFDLGQYMWAQLWESEPPPPHQFNLIFTDYKLTPCIYVSGLATFAYIKLL